MLDYWVDILNVKFHSLTAIRYIKAGKWECRCDCGDTLITYQSSLRRNQIKSCKKCRVEEYRKVYPIGYKFGKWTVISYNKGTGRICECECGEIKKHSTYEISVNNSLGCAGCSRVRVPYYDGDLEFGAWRVLDRNVIFRGVKDILLCECKCGKIQQIEKRNLLHGISTCCRSCSLVKDNSLAAFNAVLIRYKNGARTRGIEWGLSDMEFRGLITSNCYYTGLPPSCISKRPGGSFVYNGIDRLDSKKGYYIDNCVPCNKNINAMKLDLEYSKFLELCSLVTEHMKNKNTSVVNNLKAV